MMAWTFALSLCATQDSGSFLFVAAEEDAPVKLVGPVSFEPLKVGRPCLEMPVIPE